MTERIKAPKKYILFDHDGVQDFSRAGHRIETLIELKDLVLDAT